VRRNQHVVPYGEKWAVRGAGNIKVSATFDKKSEAVRSARQIARNNAASIIVHKRNGKIT